MPVRPLGSVVALLLVLLVACLPGGAPEVETPSPMPSPTPTSLALPATGPTAGATSLPGRTAPPAPGDGSDAPPPPQCMPPLCSAEEVPACPEGAECVGGCGVICVTRTPWLEPEFDGERAYQDLLAQMAFGPRYPGSEGHIRVGDFISTTLSVLGWQVEEQPLTYLGVSGRNFIARANEGAGPIIIVGAHYDSRAVADQSPGALAAEPVPGAVDGASGVAVLLELARTLDLEQIPHELWLAFFDMEDQGNGGMPGWDWIVGSTYMAENLTVTPQAMVLVDMVGDAEQQLYYEGSSDPALRAEIWEMASTLGYAGVFVPEVRHTMIDDHRPFLARGIPAVDIIDFDYPYWHTVEDTADKAAPQSLERVGRTVEAWLENGQ